jgi:hypothetical protein
VFLSDGSSKTQQKTVYKKVVSKSVYKKIDKKPQNRIFLDFVNHVYAWAFLGEGRSKTRFLKKSKKNLTSLGTFLASKEPTNHVKVRRFVFLRVPCPARKTFWNAIAGFEAAPPPRAQTGCYPPCAGRQLSSAAAAPPPQPPTNINVLVFILV